MSNVKKNDAANFCPETGEPTNRAARRQLRAVERDVAKQKRRRERNRK